MTCAYIEFEVYVKQGFSSSSFVKKRACVNGAYEAYDRLPYWLQDMIDFGRVSESGFHKSGSIAERRHLTVFFGSYTLDEFAVCHIRCIVSILNFFCFLFCLLTLNQGDDKMAPVSVIVWPASLCWLYIYSHSITLISWTRALLVWTTPGGDIIAGFLFLLSMFSYLYFAVLLFSSSQLNIIARMYIWYLLVRLCSMWCIIITLTYTFISCFLVERGVHCDELRV